MTAIPELPLSSSGKPDYAALERQARLLHDRSRSEQQAAAGRPITAESVRDDYALVLGRPDATVDSTFVGLGGDSLSYVELATRIEHRLGVLPADWHTRTVSELASLAGRRRRGASVDSTVLLRALAILAIVGTHANLLSVLGGAHLLLAVAGYNFARFQLSDVPGATRVRNGLVAVAQVAVPSALFIGALVADDRVLRPGDGVAPQRAAGQRQLDRPVAVLVPRGDRVDLAGRRWPCSRFRWSTGWSGGRRTRSRPRCWRWRS